MIFYTMEKNKQIIIGVVFTICFFGLFGYIYITLFHKKVEEEEVKIQFEVPEISHKEQNDSKIDYYNSQLDANDISDGFLLEIVKPSKEEESLSFDKYNLIGHKEDDLKKSPQIPNDQKHLAPKKRIEEHASADGDDNLSRLLDIMESNTQYMDGLEDKIPTAKKPTIKNPYYNNQLLQGIEKPSKINNDIPEPIYKNLDLKKNYNENVFFSTSKNKSAFKGAVSEMRTLEKELYKAEFYDTRFIENNGLVIIHLLEDVFFEKNFVIPKYTVLYGIAKLSPRRLYLNISPNIIKNEKRLPRPITVYDFDGLEGIFIENNAINSIPLETARELTELVKESYKNSNIITGNSAVPLKEASIILSSEKTLRYLNRLKVKISGGHKIWLSVKDIK